MPSPAEEQALDHVTIDDLLLGEHEKMYLLRVKGLSMIDAGIHEGDLLLVERTNNARVGDIVVANMDGEWTVKYSVRSADVNTLRRRMKSIRIIGRNSRLK